MKIEPHPTLDTSHLREHVQPVNLERGLRFLSIADFFWKKSFSARTAGSRRLSRKSAERARRYEIKGLDVLEE